MSRDSLRDWLSRHGSVISDEVAARSIPSMGGGCGIVALEDIAAGQLVVAVPARCMVTTKAARRYLQGLKPPPTGLAELSPEEIISSFLILAERDPSNVFYEWLRGLPRSYDNLLELPYHHTNDKEDGMRGNREKCAERSDDASADRERDARAYDTAITSMIWSPRLRSKCVTERLRFEASADRCLRRIPQLRLSSVTHAVFENEGEGCDVAAQSEEDGEKRRAVDKLLWAYNSLMSRGFSYEDETWTMMPWVDYFNYDLCNNVTMRYEPNRRRYEFVTVRPLRRGEQLMLQYGRYSDFELALWYGFTLRRALFPKCAARRKTQSDGDDDDAVDDEVVQLNTHLAYVFSPTVEPNGDLPVGVQWAVELAMQAGLAYPASWGTSTEAGTQHDPGLHDVRLCWGSVSAGMKYLVHLLTVEAKGSLSGEDVLQLLAESELKELGIGRQSAATSSEPLSTVVRMARDLSEDHVMLLKKYSEMPREKLLRFLVADT